MIESAVVKLERFENFDNKYIENELAKSYINVIRWAIVDISGYIVISVSYEK